MYPFAQFVGISATQFGATPTNLVLVVLSLLMFGGCEPAKDSTCPADRIVNVGHRGTGTSRPTNPFPENTIESFVQSINEGAQMLELDVTHTADHVLVVIHDSSVDRTTNGTGCVGDKTLAELQTLDAAFGTPLESRGVVIPTLTQVINAVDIDINIEIKIHNACSTANMSLMAQHIAKAIASDTKERRIVVSSFDANALRALQSVAPSVDLALLTLSPADVDVAVASGFAGLNVLSLVTRTPQAVRNIHDAGLSVTVWTENDPLRMADYLTWGVDRIITDEPDVLETVRAQWCDRENY